VSDAATRTAASVRVRAAFAVAFVVLLAAAVLLALALDVDLFVAANGRPLARVVQFGFTFALTIPALLAAFWRDRRKWKFAAYVAALAALVTLIFMPWHPRKRFVRDLYSLDGGMTVDEVEAVMSGYMKGAGKKWVVPDVSEASVVAPAYPAGDERAHATGTMTYRWDDSDYDSDWGQVTFADGRVVNVQFLPD
jgi:hypothetical protein